MKRDKKVDMRYWEKDIERSYYHLIAKVVENTPGNFAYAFGDSHKMKLEEMLWRLDEMYLLEVVSYCIMSNHVHIIVARKNKAHIEMSLKEAAIRYQKHYKLKYLPDARSTAVRNFRYRINNISAFMSDLQKQFAWWFNFKMTEKRKGNLWKAKFKSVHLKSRKALVECMKYVELNPVRAKLTENPGSYGFSSWGHIVKNDYIGKKLRQRIIEHLRYMMEEKSDYLSDAEVFLGYAGDLEALNVVVSENKNIKRIDPFYREYLLTKCDYWTELKVIGGEENLVGEGHGRRRPKIVEFKV
jgi:REP element-mobilizing transposase RayT